MSGKITKKPDRKRPNTRANRVAEDDVLPEYDFGAAQPNPYASRLEQPVFLVALDPDVARAFPDARSVNDALRSLARAAQSRSRKKSPGR